ncbi:cathepsin L-like [Chironomus tepperi]|uniref:cathepsin L-like n=1 Tax=Chironomus tepperi TaxID=113505 RepID=UPI00391F85D2
MKSRLSVVLLVALLIFGILADPSPSDIQSEFEKFKDEYDKEYDNKFEEYKARRNFGTTLRMIENHNADSSSTFKMDLNKFADEDPAKLRKITTNPAPQTPLMMGRAIGIINETRYPVGPPNVDWRSSNCITPVKDQSFFCNSCYAFSGVAALEAHWCLKTGRLVTMSEQQIIDCSYNAIYGNWACDGGSQATAYVNIQNIGGIQSDLTYPYLETYSHPNRFPCLFNKTKVVATTSGYWRIRPNREAALANIIAIAGPVSAAMNGSTPSFWYYSSGVYSDPQCTPSTSHSVLIVGYGTDYSVSPPMDYWLCKNSWSSDWGDNGYFKIQRGVNMCGISGFLIFPDIPLANTTQTTTTISPWIT